jgi:hypothetical protein
MRFVRPAVIALVAFAAVNLGVGGDPPKAPKKHTVMEQKLGAAQKVLEGLAQNNLTMIKENAEKLNDLSKQAAWKLVETPRYEQYSEEFQRTTLKMANQAREKNLDGAALSYVDMTLLCVKCHQHTREVKVGRLPGANRNGAGGE